MFIQTEDTPNPSTLKFIPGVDVMGQGKTMAFSALKDCKNSELAKDIFESENVRGVFFGSDFITITKAEDIEWKLLKPELVAIIMDFFVSGREVVTDKTKLVDSNNKVNDDDDFIVKQIKELLDERVRPAVAMDGGDIIFHKYEDGVVFLEMHGACSGCPSSSVTLKQGVENMLKHFIPEIEKVEAVESEEF